MTPDGRSITLVRPFVLRLCWLHCSSTLARSVAVTHFQKNGTVEEQRFLAEAMNHDFKTAVSHYCRLNAEQRAAPAQTILNRMIQSIVSRSAGNPASEKRSERAGNHFPLWFSFSHNSVRKEWTDDECQFIVQVAPFTYFAGGKNINWVSVKEKGMERFADESKYQWVNRTPENLKDKYKMLKKAFQ